jgi:hypothetical protein
LAPIAGHLTGEEKTGLDEAGYCSYGVDGRGGVVAGGLRLRRQPRAAAGFHARQGQRTAAEPPPDVKQMVRSQLDSVFVASSAPRDVRVSRPHHQIEGLGWTACVRAELTSATGKPLGTQTYRITIEDGVMLDRRHVEADDNCLSETYEPI